VSFCQGHIFYDPVSRRVQIVICRTGRPPASSLPAIQRPLSFRELARHTIFLTVATDYASGSSNRLPCLAPALPPSRARREISGQLCTSAL